MGSERVEEVFAGGFELSSALTPALLAVALVMRDSLELAKCPGPQTPLSIFSRVKKSVGVSGWNPMCWIRGFMCITR